jgi:hypothetical protein
VESRARRGDCRDAVGVSFLETLLQDTRHGVRAMMRTPVFTAIAVLVLALGIGANTAIFSVVDAVLLRPLAYRDSGKLVTILMDGVVIRPQPCDLAGRHHGWSCKRGQCPAAI